MSAMNVLIKFINTIESLATSKSSREGDVERYIQEILSKSAEALDCERVNAWVFDTETGALDNLLAYHQNKNNFSKEPSLNREDLPNYFKFLTKNEIIVADDARSEPMNEELVDTYLKPNDIYSMVDVPLRSEGNMIGVICFEFTGDFHNWSKEEQKFMQSVAQLLSLSLESDAKKKYRESLERLVRQKDILISEINHRVKNNIAIILSLINMQQRKVKDPSDEILFEDLKNKVFSMAAVQDQLRNREEIDKVEIKEYLNELVRNLKNSFDPENKVETIIKLDSISLDITKAIPLGLISNEVITNSFKYALTKVDQPVLRIYCKCGAGQIEITFEDNGPGKGDNPGYGLGMEIIESLTEQLDGVFRQHDNSGLVSVLKFQLN
jgi:two-component sensor histidine kinase